jgi:hypothetical protein
VSSQDIQQYVRIALYYGFGVLGTIGVTVPGNTKALVGSIVGALANLAWTVYGTRLNGLLEQVKAKSGVQGVEVKVDPAIIAPTDVTQNTSAGIVAKSAA